MPKRTVDNMLKDSAAEPFEVPRMWRENIDKDFALRNPSDYLVTTEEVDAICFALVWMKENTTKQKIYDWFPSYLGRNYTTPSPDKTDTLLTHKTNKTFKGDVEHPILGKFIIEKGDTVRFFMDIGPVNGAMWLNDFNLRLTNKKISLWAMYKVLAFLRSCEQRYENKELDMNVVPWLLLDKFPRRKKWNKHVKTFDMAYWWNYLPDFAANIDEWNNNIRNRFQTTWVSSLAHLDITIHNLDKEIQLFMAAMKI